MFCPKCGDDIGGEFVDHPGVTCLLHEAVCERCGIQYATVIDDQFSEYIDIEGIPLQDSPEEER